ncbi:MAG TPA: metallophosphoesterase [Miltoncostaeaceae bacterium]|nr:metallophosphoesterase [Miltoncostaeaceae bacterium]
MIGAAIVGAAVALGLPAGATAPPGAVHFAVKGDWGDGTRAQAAVTRRMCAEGRREPFAFVLTTGDNFSRPDGVATARTFWRPERCLRAQRVRWRAAWGNHDVAGADTARVLGSPRRYFAFAAGPARVVVLDGNDPTSSAQAAFLRDQLRAAREPVRIVAFHQPVYTAGIHPPAEDARRLWEPIMREGRVSLVLQGHNHAYERLEAGGITYITTGGGGAQLYPCVRPAPELRRCIFANHFLTVTATATAVTVRAVAPSGRTLERVRVEA